MLMWSFGPLFLAGLGVGAALRHRHPRQSGSQVESLVPGPTGTPKGPLTTKTSTLPRINMEADKGPYKKSYKGPLATSMLIWRSVFA